MLDRLCEGLLQTEGLDEGLQAEQTAVLESVEMFENRQYLSEVDEVRADETAEIMAEVFTPEVVAGWAELSLEQKTAKLNEYYVKAGENLGIQTKGVIVEPMYSQPGMISFGYNSGDGYIHLNEAVVQDPEMLGQVLDTATHEMRHQFQTEVVAEPGRFGDLPSDVVAQWQYEFANYISPDYDYQGYYEQAIEQDARSFADEVLQSYMEI